MAKILLCGNGINIQFNKEYTLTNFTNMLINETELETYISELSVQKEFVKFNKNIIELKKIIKKCKNKISSLSVDVTQNGVEETIKNFLIETELYNYNDDDRTIANLFNDFFEYLFFNWIWKLENNVKLNQYSPGFIKKLDIYNYIFTLNYDNLISKNTKIISAKNIIHLHGNLKFQNNELNYTNCLLETPNKTKTVKNINKLRLFVKRQKIPALMELDIVGINPKNDYHIFSLLINSRIFNIINFYYYSQNDLDQFWNMISIIKKQTIINYKTSDNIEYLDIKNNNDIQKNMQYRYLDSSFLSFDITPRYKNAQKNEPLSSTITFNDSYFTSGPSKQIIIYFKKTKEAFWDKLK